MSDHRERDLEMLNKLLDDDHINELSESEQEDFAGMRTALQQKRIWDLSPRQRSWVQDRFEQLVPEYENLVSAGKVPRGREVELMVRDKPLRPPPRRAE